MNVLIRRLAIEVGLATMLFCSSLCAHDQIPGAAQTKPILIQGATIHVIDGSSIEKGSVLFEAGKITAVGKTVQKPVGALVIPGDGKHVYPGLIESYSDIGLREISAVEATDDRTEHGDQNPNVRSWVAVNPDSELIPVTRAGGVLTAMTVPRGRWLQGQSAVIHLDGWTIKDMIVSAPAGLCVNWGAMHPSDDDANKAREKREHKLSMLDDLMDQARRYGKARKTRPENTPTDLRLESLLPVVSGERPLIAEAESQHVIESAIAYAKSNHLKLVIYGGYDAESCSEMLKQFDVPVIIGSTYRLPRRRDDPYDFAYTLPARLHKAGVKFAIGGTGTGGPGGAANARNLPYHAAVAVAYGLDPQTALRSITLSAAEVLGVDDRLGSLSIGKEATLIVADGDILETETHVTAAYIRGAKVDLGSRHKMLYEKYRLKYSRGK